MCQKLNWLQSNTSITSPVSGFPPDLPHQIMKHLFSLQPIRSLSLAVLKQKNEKGKANEWWASSFPPPVSYAHTTITVWEMPTDGQSVIVIRLAAVPKPSYFRPEQKDVGSKFPSRPLARPELWYRPLTFLLPAIGGGDCKIIRGAGWLTT